VSAWQRFRSAFSNGLKALTFTPIDARMGLEGSLPRTRYPYRQDVKQGLDSNVIMSPVAWIMRNFTEARPVIDRKTAGTWEEAEDHVLHWLLRSPNPFYSGNTLFKATLISFCTDGNAYWRKLRNVFGEVVGLHYMPHFLVSPIFPGDGSEFISYYQYQPFPGGQEMRLSTRDVVHFRFGLHPNNVRLGFSPLRTLLREVFTDEEAANFAATILRNMGVPGGIISPRDMKLLPGKDDVAKLKEYMSSAFTGDKRGEWFAFGVPTDIQQFGFDPNQLMLANLRDITEERVCAALGIPAAVVGFGAGLQQTKVGATMRELRQSAWHNCVIPMQNDIADQIDGQLLPEFTAQLRRFRTRFDRSLVSAFQEEETEKANRLKTYALAGILRLDQAQKLAGLEIDPSQAVYLRPSGYVAVKVGDPGIEEMEVAPVQEAAVAPVAESPERQAEKTINRVAVALRSLNGKG
jgi:HK97 family phage portal protein